MAEHDYQNDFTVSVNAHGAGGVLISIVPKDGNQSIQNFKMRTLDVTPDEIKLILEQVTGKESPPNKDIQDMTRDARIPE